MIRAMKKATAIRRAGGATNLAQMLGLTRQAVHQWGEDIPPLQVYRLRELRPAWFARKR